MIVVVLIKIICNCRVIERELMENMKMLVVEELLNLRSNVELAQ